MRRLLMLATLAVAVASTSVATMTLHAAEAEDAARTSMLSATVASPVPYFALFGGGFLLLSFVLILIGPRNDHRR